MISIVYNQLKEFIPTIQSIEQVDKTTSLSTLGLKEDDFENFQKKLQQSLGINPNVSLLPIIKSGVSLQLLVNVLLTIKQAMTNPIKNPTIDETFKVAVIGIGLRLPGSINTIEKYWKSLINGRNCVSPLPTNRHLHHYLNTSDNLKQGEHYISKFAYYDNTPEVAPPTYFDPMFFGMNPNEVNVLDPKFRWVFETVYEAIQDAAIDPDTLSGTNTNVYCASGQDDEINRISIDASPTGFSCLNSMSMHSVVKSSCPGRISYMYNLKGAANVVDTACSSGLIATHDAFKDLKYGETDLAIVSAAHLQFLSDGFNLLSVAKMVSRNCRCATFDADADGYVPGEGCVSIILKRLDDAVRDNNKIYGVINSTASGQSGSRPAMSQPTVKGQVNVQNAVLAKANLRPEDIDYMEAHGTGTPLGDKIETEAINQVYSGTHTKERPLIVASVKTNIGHTEEVSGLASMVKVMLAMKNKTIPPHLHLNKPSPLIDFNSVPLFVPTEKMEWEPVQGKKRTAVISSYGLQGSVCAAVVEEYNEMKKTPYPISETSHILTISAKSHAALIASAEQYITLLESIGEDAPIADLCYTSNTGRQHMSHRYAVVGRNSVELLNELTNFVNQSKKTVRSLRTKVGMSFTGQGNAAPGIGEELFNTQPVFRKAMEKCDAVVKKVTGISILDVLYKPGYGQQHIKKAQIAQPVLFAYEYAMYMLWKSWGIEPTIVNGHSLGEIVAATVAGAMDIDIAIEFIIERARCMGEYGEKPGAMASVFAKEKLLRDTIDEFGYEDEVSIAAINGVTHTVISGFEEEIDDLTEYFNQMKVKTKKLDVTDAFHSPLMDPAVEELDQWINSKGEENFRKEFKIKFISNVDGDIKSAGSCLAKGYWGKHALQTVRFTDGITSLVENEDTVLALLEVGPAATLTNMSTRYVRETPELHNKGPYFVSSSVVGQNSEQTLFNALSKLYMYGVNINWRKFHERVDRATGERIPVSIYDLPLYPFQRSRYWIETDEEVRNYPLGYKNAKKREWKMYKDITVIHGTESNQMIVSAPLTEEYVGYLSKNHKVMGHGCVPAAAYTEFIFNAMEAISKDKNNENSDEETEVFEIIDELLIRKPLNIEEDSKVDLIMKKKGSSIAIFAKLNGGEEIKMLNATADALKNCENANMVKSLPKPEHVKKFISKIMSKDNTKSSSEIYKVLDKSTTYAGGFPSVESYAVGKDEKGQRILVSHIVSTEKSDSISKSGISQVFLFDASIHSNVGMDLDEEKEKEEDEEKAKSPFLPSSFENIVKFAPIPDECFVIHKSMPGTEENTRFSNFVIYDTKGNTVLSVDSFQTRRVKLSEDESLSKKSQEFELYNIKYKEVELIQELYEIPYILIFRDHRGYADAFVDYLKTKSGEINYVVADIPSTEAPMDGMIKNYLDKMGIKPETKSIVGMVNFMALDFEDFDPVTVDGTSKEFQDKLRSLYEPNLMLSQAFVRVLDEYNNKNIICFVTKNASDFWEGDIDPFQGIMGGLSKSVWKEFIEIRTFNLDVHRTAKPKDVAKQVLDEMMSSTNRYNVSFEVVYDKDNKRYQGITNKETNSSINFSGKGDIHYHGTILLTGGLGGVATDMTHYLLEQPDVTGLILIGRRPESDGKVAEALAKVRAINSKVKIVYANPNIASEKEMRQLLADIPKLGLEPLTGVIHTAGITDDAFIYNQNYERFAKLAQAKVEGNICMAHITEGLNLDFTILFSSMAAFFGNRGQINYVTVNMFSSKMALYYNRRRGRKDMVCIELGGWPSGLTIVIKDDALLLNPENGVNMLSNVIARAKEIYPVNVGLPKVNWNNVNDITLHDPVFRPVRPTTRPMGDLSNMNDSTYVSGANNMNSAKGNNKKSLASDNNNQIDDDEESDNEDDINEDNVFEIMEKELKKVLQYGESDEIDQFQPLTELGIDSIMMMELRTIFRNATTVNIPLVVFSTQNICLFRLVEFVKAKLAKEKLAEGEKVNEDEEEEERKRKRGEQMKKDQESGLISDNEVDQWISLVNTEEIEEPLNVFIQFPSADEGEVDFEPWIENLEDSLIFKMELPGYGKRKDEAFISNWDLLAKNMAKVIINYFEDNKFKDCSSINFIGQSFGALLAWKTLLQIQAYEEEDKNVPIISTLIISRVFAPSAERPITIDLNGSKVVLSQVPVDQISEIQTKLGNKNDFTSESLRYLLPVIHNEYLMADNLDHDSQNDNMKIRSKLLMFSGKQDNIINEGNSSLWKKEVSFEFNEFTQHIKMRGDYWFVQSSLKKYFSSIMENLD